MVVAQAPESTASAIQDSTVRETKRMGNI